MSRDLGRVVRWLRWGDGCESHDRIWHSKAAICSLTGVTPARLSALLREPKVFEYQQKGKSRPYRRTVLTSAQEQFLVSHRTLVAWRPLSLVQRVARFQRLHRGVYLSVHSLRKLYKKHGVKLRTMKW